MNWKLSLFSSNKSPPKNETPAPPSNPTIDSVDNVTSAMNGINLRNTESRNRPNNPRRPSNRREITAERNATKTVIEPTADVKNTASNFESLKMVGHGSFGTVFTARDNRSGTVVAIKKVLQDNRFKNRELMIMVMLSEQQHPYVLKLISSFATKGSKADEVYLNLVLEFVPETLYSLSKYYQRRREVFPISLVRIYMYQLSRALAHIHGMGICHRDVKPQNLLVNPSRCVLKLCDFGSAKILVSGEPNIAYICSRFYRAPELVFGATNYTVSVDVWSEGCVFAELLTGSPIFPGSSGVDQLVEIVKILGTPTKEEVLLMNPNYQEFKFPNIPSHPWNTIIRTPGVPPEALDVIDKILKYVPSTRLKAIEACAHPFFDPLRDQSTSNLENQSIRDYFQFTKSELSLCPDIESSLFPDCWKNDRKEGGFIDGVREEKD